MEHTPTTMEETMAKLGRTIDNARPEQKQEIKVFLEGYMAGLEYQMTRAEECSR